MLPEGAWGRCWPWSVPSHFQPPAVTQSPCSRQGSGPGPHQQRSFSSRQAGNERGGQCGATCQVASLGPTLMGLPPQAQGAVRRSAPRSPPLRPPPTQGAVVPLPALLLDARRLGPLGPTHTPCLARGPIASVHGVHFPLIPRYRPYSCTGTGGGLSAPSAGHLAKDVRPDPYGLRAEAVWTQRLGSETTGALVSRQAQCCCKVLTGGQGEPRHGGRMPRCRL